MKLKEAWRCREKWEDVLDHVAGKKVTLSWFMNSYMVKNEEHDNLDLVFRFKIF